MKISSKQDKPTFQPLTLTLVFDKEDEFVDFTRFVAQYDHLADEACTHNSHIHFNNISKMLEQILKELQP